MKKNTTANKEKTGKAKSEIYEAVLKNAVSQDILISLINESPFNRRTFYNQKSLEELASDMKIHGVLHDIAVRPKQDGRYELMFGHRRLRAARIAGFKTIPAKVVPATDEQAKEIIFSENIHRENPHAMDEAYSIGDMQSDKKSFEDIALTLGKSKQFVYTRIKLLNLTEPIQEIFLHDKISIQEALNIATLSKDSQEELCTEVFRNWRGKDFNTYNLSNCIKRFRYDLTDAPFDIADKNLLPSAGSCQKCPFNSATLKSLFPELAKEATCTNKGCYRQKCQSHVQALIIKSLSEVKPDSLLFYNGPSDEFEEILKMIPETRVLPRHNVYELAVNMPPDAPDREDYNYENEEAGDDFIFDEEEYNAAITQYLLEVEQYNDEFESGQWKKGLLISEDKVIKVLFDQKKSIGNSYDSTLTAKSVQEAIKAGTATPELLQQELTRINSKEERAKQLDKEKVQLKVHEEFHKRFSELSNNELTKTDLIGARLIIYQSLDYQGHCAVDAVLFPKGIPNEDKAVIKKLTNLTEQEFAFLIRMAMSCKSDSKYPNNVTGKCLYAMAEDAALEVKAIDKEQQEKAKVRNKKLKERIHDLEENGTDGSPSIMFIKALHFNNVAPSFT